MLGISFLEGAQQNVSIGGKTVIEFFAGIDFLAIDQHAMVFAKF